MISFGFNIAVRTSLLILLFCKNTSGLFIGYGSEFLFVDNNKTFNTRRCSDLFLSAELANSQIKNSPIDVFKKSKINHGEHGAHRDN